MRLFTWAQVRTASFLRRIYCRKEIIVFQKALDGSGLPVAAQIRYELRQVDSGNVGDVVDMDSADLLNELRTLLKNGEKGFYAYYQERPIHRSWALIGPAKAPILYDFLHYTLKDGEALIHYCQTKKDYRNKGIYASVLNEIGKRLSAGLGIKRLVIAVEDNNPASLAGVKKAGFTESKRMSVFNLMGFSVKNG
jgi:GNAT superfamily N-acetyltransferase